MKVILQQDVKGQGKKGQLVEVSDGYGRNFLLPRKLAVEATSDNLNTMKLQEKARRAEEARQRAAAEEIAERLKGLTVKIYAKTGKDGRLFGAITSKEISRRAESPACHRHCQAENRSGRGHQSLRWLSNQMQTGL